MQYNGFELVYKITTAEVKGSIMNIKDAMLYPSNSLIFLFP